ncbi:MAG: ABC transporter substrate-binding protein [bacterium]|nr:ABC transporter substrate-binding protein [bacterium]MCM1374514.1 ABC transporter substrate-binding protein [Muribaculum sp.]
MDNMNWGNRRGRMVVMAFLVGLLLLVGCGKEPAESGELPTERTEQAEEVTASADEAVDESEKHFQYDFRKLYPHLYEGMNVPEKIVSEEQARAEGRVILTLQESFASSWLAESIKGFNRQSTDYFVSLQESGWGGPEQSDCMDRMAVEIMAGRGPDIFTGDMFEVNESILRKGVLVDLSAGLDAMGITEEEYFPSVWALQMGDAVYGVCPVAYPEGYWIKESVLGSRETPPDIETLVEKLYTYPDQNAVWRPHATTTRILYYLLVGSEDLWGMIDWEEGKCDFSGELFAKMLEIAKRYVDPEAKKEEGIMGFYNPAIESDVLEKEQIRIDFPFDDGYYPFYRPTKSLMLNANSDSEHQEGAWEFIKYILGEEGQGYCSAETPANKEMYKSYYQWRLDQIKAGVPNTTLTEERVEENFHDAERARYFPVRTATILEIICEEAQAFTDGDKSKEEVCKLIQNRVQLYLDETR